MSFDAARRGALMRDLVALLAGRPMRLLPFEEVRESLKLRHLIDRGLAEVPLAKIVGSLGRAREFSRAFLPRREAQRDRWERIEDLAEGPEGFPPVELYKVSEAYFVVDGHHRISVLRSMGTETVEAWVKEFLTSVPLDPEESIDEVLLKRGLADFLEATGLDPRERHEFEVSVANGYERLLEHISGHRYYMGLEAGYPIAWRDAAHHWAERVFRPMIDTIRASGIVRRGRGPRRRLEGFEGRTEADLYLFTMDHLHELRQRYGHDAVDAGRAVDDLAEKRLRPDLRRQVDQVIRRLRPDDQNNPEEDP